MKEVGDKFGAGELILPFVLQSAEVMKKAVAHLEKSLDRKEGTTKGKVVLATVYGDVHDIGKSLVNTILSNNGYTVFDLGKQVPANVIIDKAVEVDATAIGLSALLVSTSKQMPLIVNELQRRGLHYPGAHRRRGDQSALWAAHLVHRIRRALRLRRVLLQRRVRGTRHDGEIDRSGGARGFCGAHHCRSGSGGQQSDNQTISNQQSVTQRPTSNVQRLTSKDIPTPPFWGSRVIREMPLEMVLATSGCGRTLSLAVGREEYARR